MFPTKILLATDGSAEAERAARTATTLSERLESELHLAHVGPMPDPGVCPEATLFDRNLLVQTRERAESEGRDVLDAQMRKLEAMGAEIAGSYLRVGRPDAEIVKLAEEIGAGLIVVGSRPRRGTPGAHGERLRLGGASRRLPGAGRQGVEEPRHRGRPGC